MSWDVDPVYARLGALELRYYGVLFMLGVGVAAWAFFRYARRAGIAEGHAAAMTILGITAAAWAARAVHLVFYDPGSIAVSARWLAHAGFASHGAVAGAVGAIAIYARLSRLRAWSCLDAAMSGAVAAVPLFRLGNLMNSEIVGRRWDGPWAMAFPRFDCRAQLGACDAPLRHPAQIYEALAGVAVVVLAVYLQARWRERLRPGVIFAVLVAATFGTRFVLEAFKEYQGVDPVLTLTMGQLLSIPFVVTSAALLILWRARLTADPAASSRA